MIYNPEIDTTILTDDFNLRKVKVFVADSFHSIHDIREISYVPVLGRHLPYLSTAYCYGNGVRPSWYFSNANRHAEMEEAMKIILGRRDINMVMGQISFHQRLLLENTFKFQYIMLFAHLPKPRGLAIKQFYGGVNEDFLMKNFEFREPRD